VKKLINAPANVVRESLEGLAAAHADLVRVHFNPTFVCRADAPAQGKVALLSGGGSGHEPMHTGFVGHGMLDAACPGEVFTSPTPDQVLEATKAAHGGAGVVFLVKNYAGDVMNFDMAAELARAEGIPIETALVDDDVAVATSEFSQGRRGVGATVLAEKIGGAAAALGMPMPAVAEVCRRVNESARSMGMALTSCTVPARGEPTFALGPTEMEIGIGIHGERGRARAPLAPVRDVMATLAEAVLTDLPFKAGDQVLAFVNGLGGTPLAELYIAYRELVAICRGRGLSIARQLVGSYMTSLEMAGMSITLLRLDGDMTRFWDHPVHTPALRWGR
jgi:dihydroxyacetone kinase-like protein